MIAEDDTAHKRDKREDVMVAVGAFSGFRLFAALFTALAAAASAGPSLADPVADFYRGKTVSVFIGFGPGGGYDLSARVLARHMGRHIPGQPTLVPKNMPAAGSLQLANYLYNVAPRDGTEFGIFGRTLPIDPLIGTQGIQFDPLKFTWLGSTSNEVSTCVAWHTAPVKTAADVFRHELHVGAAGAASPSGVFPHVFNAVLGTKFKVITGYPGSANILTALEAGELTGFCAWGWVPMSATKPDWIRDKKFNVLFQIGLRKHPEHPDVPLILDFAKTPQDRQVLELVVAPQTFARPFAAPPGVPAERAAALRQAFEATLKDAAFIAEAEKLKLEPELVTAGEIEQILQRIYASPPEIIARARAALQVP
jgi:tripartite-type tricarboxylate transporter receptor subunit TctC